MERRRTVVERRLGLVILGGIVIFAAILLITGRHDASAPPPAALLPDAKKVLAADPLAWTPSRTTAYEQAAAAGLAHVLYAKSPGGLAASAARTATWRPLIEQATRGTSIPANTLEAIVLLESAGRPEAQAGSLDGAVGLTQILAETGSSLLGMHVDVAASRRLSRQIDRADLLGQARRGERLRAQRRRVDQRFDPKAELAATVRYLELAHSRLGRDDLAIASYHMGIGNLQTALSRYGAARVPYAQLYFDTTPLRHAAAWRFLASLGDDSSTYLWRIGAARNAMALLRSDRSRLQRLSDLQTRADDAALALHPPGSTASYGDADALKGAYADGTLVELPAAYLAARGVRVDPSVGVRAPQADGDPRLYRGLRREALATLAYIGSQVARIAPGDAPLHLAGAVRDTSYARAEVVHGDPVGPLATTGWTFDIARRYASRTQAVALQYVLDRLTALNLIAWQRTPSTIQVTAASGASRLEAPEGVRGA